MEIYSQSYCTTMFPIVFFIFLTLPVTKANITMELICRENNKIVIGFQNYDLYENITLEVYNNKLLYKKQFSELPKIHEIKHLKSGILYDFHLYYDEFILKKKFKTFSNMFDTNIEFANVTEMYSKGDSLSIVFFWIVPEKNCNYDILVWSKGHDQEVVQISPQYDELYNIEIQNIQYSTNYSIAVYSYSEDYEGPKYWYNFTTPSCNHINDHNYTICRPPDPEGLKIDFNQCDIVVYWKKPIIDPDLYIIDVISQNYTLSAKLNGTKKSYTIDFNKLGEIFNVYLKSKGASGPSKTIHKQFQNKCFNGFMRYLNILNYAFPIFVVAMTILFVIIIKNNKNRIVLHIDDKEAKIINESKDIIQYEDTEYEITIDKLEILNIIGQGEFGIVHRANFMYEKGKYTEVAVKILKDNLISEDKKQFEKEVEVMKRVGAHANIVSMIGYSMKYIVVEYCELGNLQNFLRNVWKSKIIMREMAKSSEIGVPIEHGVSNFLYDETDLEKKQFTLTIMDLISFARQIAIGMEYLSRNRVIHRDLAARNVLLTSDLILKISDFGLSRDVYEENIYKKKSSAKLPIKWMAVESLVHHIFTTQSDVWSYGILLWEIMTLGCVPYPDLLSGQICNLLLQGYRMERPSACSNRLYQIMLSCWDAVPHKRPCFKSLVKEIDAILENESPNKYLQLDCSHYVDIFPQELKWKETS